MSKVDLMDQKYPIYLMDLHIKLKKLKKYAKVLLDKSLFKIFKNRIDETVIRKYLII